MFLKKSLLFTTALALLMFAGQASAQVTLSHVTDGTAGTVAGNGTSFTVRISPGDLATNPAVVAALASVTTVAAIEIQLEYASSLSLSVALPYRLDSTNTKVTLIGGPALTGAPLAVPEMIDLTFTTTADVTGVEFSISITGATVSVGSGADNMFPFPVTAMITFNEGGTGTPPGDGNGGDNGDTGMPTPEPMVLSVSLTRVGEGPVAAGDEVVINVAVDGLTAATIGAVITIESDVATIKEDGVMAAAGFRVLESDDTSATLFGVPTMLTDGSYGTVTLTLSDDYDGSMASINASVTVLTPDGMKVPAAAGDAVMVTGMPMPDYDDLSVSLTRVGEGPVAAGDEVVINVGVDGLTTATIGAVITIESDVATIKEDGVMAAAGFSVLDSDDTSATLFGVPTMLTDGSYGTVTLTLSDDYDGSMASINASVTVLAPGGMKVPAAAGDAVMVTGFSPSLEASATEVTVPHGETAMATVTAMGTEDEEVIFAVEAEGVEYLREDGMVTLSATGNGTATVSAMVGGVATNSVTVVFMKAPAELQTEMEEVVIPRDGSATATVIAVGFAEGASLDFSITGGEGFKTLDDGVSWEVTTSNPGDVSVTVTDGTETASITITFVPEPPELEADVAEATIPVGGSATAVVTALGLGDGIEYTISKSGTAEVDDDTDGAMATLTASGTGSAEVSVTATDAAGRTTAPITITFMAGELTLSSVEPLGIPVGGSGSVMVTASGQANDDDVVFALAEEVEGVTLSSEGATVTLSAMGAATAMVMASVGDVTATATVEFVDRDLVLVASVDAPVSVMPGGMGMATVTLMGLAEGEMPSFSIEPAFSIGPRLGTVDGNVVTLSSMDDATATVSAMVGSVTTAEVTVEFELGDLTLSADPADPVTVLPGGSGMVTLTATGQAEGAEVAFALGEGAEGVTLDNEAGTLTATGAGMATVTAMVGDVESNAVDVVFEQGALTLSSDADAAVTVAPGGMGMVTLTASGQAEGAEVAFALSEGAEGVTLDNEAGTLTATGAGMATVTAMVGDVASNAVDVVFEQGALTLSSDADAAVTVAPGGMGMVTLTASGQAEGAEVAFALGEGAEGVTLDSATGVVSATGAGMGTVTAMVGDVASNAVDVMFEQGPLMLSADATEAEIPYGDSGMVMVTASGQADGADVVFSSDNEAVTVTENEDGTSATVSASSAATAMITAAVGDVMSESVTIAFVPSLYVEMEEVEVPLDGSPATAVISTVGFPPGAEIKFNTFSNTDIQSSDDGSTLTVTSSSPGDVTVVATDGTHSISLTVTFVGEGPKLEADAAEATIPVGGSVEVVVTALGFADDAEISFQTNVKSREGTEGVATVDTKRDGATLILTATGRSGAVAEVTASDGTTTTASISIAFMAGELALEASKSEVMVPVDGTGSTTVTASGQANDDDVVFALAEEVEGVTLSSEGATATVTATGAATATVMASVGDVTATATVEFVDGALQLVSSVSEPVMVAPGGSGSATVTLMNLAEGEAFSFTIDPAELGTVDGNVVTLSASGDATVSVTASVNGLTTGSVTVEFEQAPLMLSSDADAAVTVLPGGSGMVTLTASGQADGAEVTFALGEGAEGVTLDSATGVVSATGAGMGTVTAMVGDVASNAVDVMFEQAPLMLSSDADAAVTVLPGGSGMVTLTASGQAEGAEVTFALGEGAEGVTLASEGTTATVSASGAGMGTVTATVGDVASNAVDVMFEQGALTLAGDAAAVIPYGGSGSAMLTASGQADGAEVAFAVEGEGVTAESEGATMTVSASAPTTAMVTAAVGDVMSNTVEVVFEPGPPELRTETHIVVFPYGGAGEASVMAVGFAEDAQIQFEITGGTLTATDDQTVWTVTTSTPGDVMLRATDGMVWTDLLTITFRNPDPYLMADATDVVIPDGGEVTVTITSIGLDANNTTYTFTERSGTAKVDLEITGTQAVLTASGEGSASVTLTASDGTTTTEPIMIIFRAMPTVATDMADVMVPPTVVTVPIASTMVTADGFAPDATVEFVVEVVSGEVTESREGNVLTLESAGSAVVTIMATDGTITTDPVTVTFTKDAPAAPASVAVQDQPGDNGYYVMVSFANSASHAEVSQYRVYREMMVNTTLDADGNVVPTDTPTAKWVPWAVVDAISGDEDMTRAVVPVTDNMATRWGVAAEAGMGSAEDVITPAGKRVFSKESVQLIAKILGLDPNRIVSQDALAQMFMPSADYIKSIIGDRKNVVFAALDPDMSVLIGGDVAVPQNIRTDGSGPIISSPITETEDMMGALDNTAPASVTDVAADVETGIITWTLSADDMVVGMINYRGYTFPIPGVLGYRVMGGASADAMIEIGIVPAGTSTFQVPQALIEGLINQGLPAVLMTVVAMDGTNMTSSVPLVVELVPTRRAFADADGGPVYIVKLDEAMTPLTVDFEDFVAFTVAFNTDETHENWRVFVQADLNDDKMVNFNDFILFFSSYGKEATGRAGKSLIPPLGVNENAEFSLRLGSDRVVVGENMFVDVSLANVQALMGYGFVLNYDAERFEFVEAVPAAEDLLKSAGGETPLFRALQGEAGQVHIMNAIVNGSEVSGDGDVVRLVFRVLRDFEDNARFEIADGLVFDPSQFANPLVGGVLDIQTTPTEFALLQNFPNPFNPETTIGYELAESADVTLQIYNVVGQVVRTLMAAESQSVGRYQVRWDGMDDRGMPVSSGIYFYQISAGKFQDVRKLMLLK